LKQTECDEKNAESTNTETDTNNKNNRYDVYQDISDKINAVDFTNRVNEFLNSSSSDNECDGGDNLNEGNIDKVSRLSSAHTSYHDLPSSFNENMKTEKLSAMNFSPNGGASNSSTANNRHNNNNNNDTANTSMTNVTKYEQTESNTNVHKNSASSNLLFDSKSKSSYSSSNNVRFDDRKDEKTSPSLPHRANLNSSFELKSSFFILKTPCCNDIVKTVETTSFLPSSFNENFLLKKTSGTAGECGNFSCNGGSGSANRDPLQMDGYSSTMSMPSKRATYFSCSYEPKPPQSNLDDPFMR
jgi:hypothetical protein